MEAGHWALSATCVGAARALKLLRTPAGNRRVLAREASGGGARTRRYASRLLGRERSVGIRVYAVVLNSCALSFSADFANRSTASSRPSPAGTNAI